MTLKVLGAGIFLAAELVDFAVPPAWRKATRNMIMATASIQKALTVDPRWLSDHSERIALVVGTCSGELETTAEFLNTLATTGVARPLLFQNSLHNATAGFATIHFKVRGPSLTLSSGGNTPSECILLAENLIAAGQADLCIVTLVEGHRRLAEALGDGPIIEGACTLILSSPAMAESLGRAGAPELDRAAALKNYPVPLEHPPFFKITESGPFAVARGLTS